MTNDEVNACGRDLEQLLKLRTRPVALKMLADAAAVPAGAVRPRQDHNEHFAFCQAVSLARRQGLTVAMFKEDHWCFAPLLAYGIMPDPDDDFLNAQAAFPCLPLGTYRGTVCGPLDAVTFEPDVVLVYCDPAQLRLLLMAVKTSGGGPVTSEFDPIDSCAYAVVPVLQTGEYRITVPDPGEHARAAASDDEMIFSIPGARLAGLVAALRQVAERERNLPWSEIAMRPDFPRPEFYDRIFRTWDLDTQD